VSAEFAVAIRYLALESVVPNRISASTGRVYRGRHDLRGVPLTVAIDGQDVVEHSVHIGISGG